ncbi:triose-phosphate isomerase [Candidatus Phytoplasma pyri]|uniref:triose-phosphate isomerase n=1 Tax=Candidatus Phytoplasma pyri TaxID=47566 RepID=UPI0039831400
MFNMKRKILIAGNWKMYKSKDEALEFIYQINTKIPSFEQIETIIFPQFTLLDSLIQREGSKLQIGAQNTFHKKEGPFTGEVSPTNLKQLGVKYVLLGHSERINLFYETYELINLKILASLKEKLKIILCIGENFKINEIKKKELFLAEKFKKLFNGVSLTDFKNIVIAYEPSWSIGTGEIANLFDINQTFKFIRKKISQFFSLEIANKTRIIYGGSVNFSNIQDILEQEEIDGVLVGNSSLKVKDFLFLTEIAKKVALNKNNFYDKKI